MQLLWIANTLYTDKAPFTGAISYHTISTCKRRTPQYPRGTQRGNVDECAANVKSSYVSSWALSNVIAGSDTTAVAMRVLMFNLLSHPESLERLSQELKDTIESTGLTTPFPTWKELKDLPYLDACVNEALRLQPPVCLPFERVAPRGGITLCGRHFKDGTILGMNPYVVHRHRPTFGQDADKWRPERWLLDGANHRRMLDESLLSVSPYQQPSTL